MAAVVNWLSEAATMHWQWLTTSHKDQEGAPYQTLLFPWAVQFVFSWLAFFMYMKIDWEHFQKGTLQKEKLPSRHPMTDSPVPPEKMLPDGTLLLWDHLLPKALCPRVSVYWYTQLFMLPLVLFNQLVVWPLTSLLIIWPQWQQRAQSLSEFGYLKAALLFVPLILISDQMWYWSHRLMHVPWCWRNWHRMHHIAPQAALSATYVHEWEYCLFAIAMQLPFALTGFPMWVHAVPLGWGMFTGAGAHSGYGGTIANGEPHGTGHHLYHSSNFGLVMVADRMYGTYWEPGTPPPSRFALGDEIEQSYQSIKGAGAAEAEELIKHRDEKEKGQ